MVETRRDFIFYTADAARSRPGIPASPLPRARGSGDDAAQARVGDPEGGAGRHGLEAARKLVLALRAGLEALQSVVDGVFDAAVVAQLEVQARAVDVGAPVAAVERGIVAVAAIDPVELHAAAQEQAGVPQQLTFRLAHEEALPGGGAEFMRQFERGRDERGLYALPRIAGGEQTRPGRGRVRHAGDELGVVGAAVLLPRRRQRRWLPRRRGRRGS